MNSLFDINPVHTLYVGSRDGLLFPDADRQVVIETTAAAFDCFTVFDADGFYKGRSVATLVIKIATTDEAAVEMLGYGLGLLLEQDAVGLETAGYYKSISMVNSPSVKPYNHLENRSNDWATQLRASGHTVVEVEPQTDTQNYSVTFVPKTGARRINADEKVFQLNPCTACGTLLEPDGRCRACWGDVVGLCDTCNGILNEAFVCLSCTSSTR
jgi:hypothetical protein